MITLRLSSFYGSDEEHKGGFRPESLITSMSGWTRRLFQG